MYRFMIAYGLSAYLQLEPDTRNAGLRYRKNLNIRSLWDIQLPPSPLAL
jgi:hypothetical protein